MQLAAEDALHASGSPHSNAGRTQQHWGPGDSVSSLAEAQGARAAGDQGDGCGKPFRSSRMGGRSVAAHHGVRQGSIAAVLLLGLLAATAAAWIGNRSSGHPSSPQHFLSSSQHTHAAWWQSGLDGISSAGSDSSSTQAVDHETPSSSGRGDTTGVSTPSRQLLSRWSLLGLRSNRISILQALLLGDEAASSAAKEAASAEGRATRLLLTDLYPNSTTPGSGQERAPPRFLATAAQGPAGAAGQGLQPVGVDAQPLCSATINYGASVGDASKKATIDVPIYVGSFDVVVTQPQNFAQVGPEDGSSRWVLGWQFAAGEHLQQSKDVFGDIGIQKVFMQPSLQQDAGDADTLAMPTDPNNRQRVAVFSNTSLDGTNSEVIFSFVGRKGPAQPALSSAPFRVAPPTYVFLNNHYCWPLFRPQSSSGTSPAAVAAAAAGSGAAVGRGSPGTSPAGAPGVQEAGQQEMVEVATPRLAPVNMPKLLQVEYLPVEKEGAQDEGSKLFAKTATQFYFKITNTGADTVYLDQVVLQYWFHGPLDGTTDAGSNGTGSAGGNSVIAQVSASQFRLTCSDATPEIGCGGLAWNVTPGLPTAFGARYVLNIWFPPPQNNDSSSDGPQRFIIGFPGNSSSTNASTAGRVQSLPDVQGIVAIEPRRFFANISATNDYSYVDTPILSAQQGGNSSDTGKLVMRRREKNPRMPAYIAQQLAWGSPPVAGTMAPRPGSGNSSVPGGKGGFPPGSYCQPSPGGGLVCGVDVLYCCLGSGPLNLTGVPPDWQQRLMSGTNPVSTNKSGDPGSAVPVTGGNPAVNGTPTDAANTGSNGLSPGVLAVAVVLPVVAALAALAGCLMFARHRKRRRALHFVPVEDSGSKGLHRAGGMLQGQQPPWNGPHEGAGGPAGGNALYAALLPPGQGQFGPGGWAAGDAAAGADAAERGQGYGLLPQAAGMQLADWQLIHHAHAQQPQQGSIVGSSHYSDQAGQAYADGASMQAAVVAAAAAPQRQLLRVLRPKANSLPGDVVAAAVRFAKQQQHIRQRQSGASGDCSRPGSPVAQASRVPFQSGQGAVGCGDSDSCASTDAAVVRCHSWTGRMHEDAFEDDLLDQLLNIHMRPQQLHSPTASLQGPPNTTDGVWQQLQQQHQPQLQGAGAAAAAAVEAAVAAINALLLGTMGSPRPPSPGLSRYPPGRHKKPPGAGVGGSSSAGRPGSPSGVDGSGPSFYRALIATGGVLRPPGGPPIPLNVDYAAEIQPNLGRLLGRGGFGHVYEATWRGQRVAVKLLTVDTEDPAVLDAFLKEVALCACLRGCDRVVRLLGACLGGCGTTPAPHQQSSRGPSPSPPPSGPALAGVGGALTPVAGSTYLTSSTSSTTSDAAAAAGVTPSAPGSLPDTPSLDITPFQSQLPPDVEADDTPPASTSGQQPQQQQQWALIMELVEGGNLAHRIYHPSKRRLSYLEILQIGLDIASGLAYLHPAVVHRDLKPQNVLLDKHGRAKIADFGISRFKDPHRSYLSVTHQGGTPNYMAPELFNASRVDEAADVYSLGCILYECLARMQPFGHLAEDGKSFNILYKIIVAVAINKERPPLPSDTPPRMASLILRCWSENPAGRPQVTELLAELEDMMREALHEHAERTGRLGRASSLSSRSQSLPNQSLHIRKDSTSSIVSNISGISGTRDSSPARQGPAVRGAQTLPAHGAPLNSLPSSSAAAAEGGVDSSRSVRVWQLPEGPAGNTGSNPGSNPGSSLRRYRSGTCTGLTLPSGGAQLPSIASAIAGAGSSVLLQQLGSNNSSMGELHPHAAAAQPQFCTPMQTGAAAVLPDFTPGSRRASASSDAGRGDPSSPRPFHDQQLLVLQQEQQHSSLQHHQQEAQLQQQQLGQCASFGSSGCNWACRCCGSPEPCAACTGSTSSSDCGSSHGGGGSSGGSVHQTPTSTSPLHVSSPVGGRQLHILPQIPQDMPALPLQLPSCSADADVPADADITPPAAGAAAGGVTGFTSNPGFQLSSLQATLLRPKASIASPQTPARNAQVGRKPSQLSSHASGALFPSGPLFASQGSLPAHTPESSDMAAHTPPAPAAATAYPALLHPLHDENLAAATAAAFSRQPAPAIQNTSIGSNGGSSGGSNGSARLRQQQSASLPKQRPAATAGSVDATADAASSSSLSQQRSACLPQYDRTSAGSSSTRPLQSYDHQQQQQNPQAVAGLPRSASSLPPFLARSTSSVPSEAITAGELSSSQSSSPSAVAASVYSVGSSVAGLRSMSLEATSGLPTGTADASCDSYISSSNAPSPWQHHSPQLQTTGTALPAAASAAVQGHRGSRPHGPSRLRSASVDSIDAGLDFGSNTSMYTNPLYGLQADSWHVPQLQMRYSDPVEGSAAGSSRGYRRLAAVAAAAANQRSPAAPFASAGAGAAAAAVGVDVDVGRRGSHGGVDSGGTVSGSSDTFVTARSYAAGSGTPAVAVDALGDFSIHGNGAGRSSSGSTAAGSAATKHLSAVVPAAAAAGVARAGSSADGPVARKVSFAGEDEIIVG